MDGVKRLILLAVICFYLGFANSVIAAPASSEADRQLRAKKEAAEKVRREKNEKKAAEARAKREAKAQAQAQAKAKRIADARFKEAYAKAKKDADASIAAAKKTRDAQLAAHNARSRMQTKRLEAQVDAEKKSLKKKYEQDKARLAAQQERDLAAANKNKKQAEAEAKRASAQLDSNYNRDLAAINAKAKQQAQLVAADKKQAKMKLTDIEAQGKKQASGIKVEKAALKRQYAREVNAVKAEQKRAVANAKAQKATKAQISKLNATYKDRLDRAKVTYRADAAKIDEKGKAQASQIAQAKKDQQVVIKELDAKATNQAKDIRVEKADLKAKLKYDKEMANPITRLKSQQKAEMVALTADYNNGVEALDKKLADNKEAIAMERHQIEDAYKSVVAKENLKLRLMKDSTLIDRLNLAADDSPKLTVKEITISGNRLVGTSEIIDNMPVVYNASDGPVSSAQSDYLYDFRSLYQVIVNPGEPRSVSTRTIQGFTDYILSLYQKKNYAGVYVYVPAQALQGNELKDSILPIEVLEAKVADVSVKYYSPDQEQKDKGYLNRSYVMDWSPVKLGKVANQKELNDFVNLLNLNPDRYVSAVVTQGSEPNSLAVGYDIYEVDPWHFFVQIDSSGTEDRRWTPRVGVINTNLLGFDDIFTVVYQAPWDKRIENEYALFGSYDFPLLGPRLRLNINAGYSQFDVIQTNSGVDFLGNGSFVGGVLRWNVFQIDEWFFDLLGTLSAERSRVSSMFLGSTFNDSVVRMAMIGWGGDIHHRDDRSDTRLTYTVASSFKTSGQESFTQARAGSDTSFTIRTLTGAHSMYLDANDVQRVTGTLRWIDPDERLVPAKMTTFGGLYTVRGYREDQVVADGGFLASLQYEFDLVNYFEAQQGNKPVVQQQSRELPWIRKVAPLVFYDVGIADIESPQSGEKGRQNLQSVGTGVLTELGDNFSAGVYYGVPLINAPGSGSGNGRWGVSMMVRW